MMAKDTSNSLTVALAGNPNSGKTTVFNALTGARQHVGNYPGVTVEKKEGHCTHKGRRVRIVDLPGTYSLTAYSLEERVARDFLLDEKPDVVIDIVDASNLERHLYLATQLLELGVPLVLAFNMSDVAKARGYEFDLDQFTALWGVPAVPTVGSRGEGLDHLLDAAVGVAEGRIACPGAPIRYGREIEEELGKLEADLARDEALTARYSARWLALKLLEQDAAVQALAPARVNEAAGRAVARLEALFGDRPEVVIADRRYGFISGACQESVRNTIEARHNFSDRVDLVLAHPVLGLPIFLFFMYVVFHITFTLGGPPMQGLEYVFARLGAGISGLWPEGSESALRSLLVDGVIGGVGGVVVFLPNIVFLFLGIALLEDSGYMARAAFVMDRFMHRVHLHGKSFIPMLIGFGCSVPAIMATRILESRRDRFVTILVIPFISCGARLTIYALFIPAFFAPQWRAPVLWLLYLIGIVLALAAARLLRTTLFRGETTPFVMELPPYRMPTVRGALLHTWRRAWMYLRKAGTVILAISIVLWALTSYPKPPGQPAPEQPGHAQEAARALEYSVAGRIGHALEPVLAPMGMDKRLGTALLGAFAAKEVLVAQLGIVFAVNQDDDAGADALRERLQQAYSPLTGFCVMLFCLIGFPCVATVAITRAETGAWKWALLQAGGMTVLAYVITTIVYQAGRLLGLGA